MYTSASIQEIKKELEERSLKEVIGYCLTLAKYKKDSKEFLSYLLFESGDTSIFSTKVRNDIDEHFSLLKVEKNLYFTKKSLRKILRIIMRYSRYSANNAMTAEWLIYFCTKLIDSGIPFRDSPVLVKMYQNQIKKIKSLVEDMHEDLQQDYLGDLDRIISAG